MALHGVAIVTWTWTEHLAVTVVVVVEIFTQHVVSSHWTQWSAKWAVCGSSYRTHGAYTDVMYDKLADRQTIRILLLFLAKYQITLVFLPFARLFGVVLHFLCTHIALGWRTARNPFFSVCAVARRRPSLVRSCCYRLKNSQESLPSSFRGGLSLSSISCVLMLLWAEELPGTVRDQWGTVHVKQCDGDCFFLIQEGTKHEGKNFWRCNGTH